MSVCPEGFPKVGDAAESATDLQTCGGERVGLQWRLPPCRAEVTVRQYDLCTSAMHPVPTWCGH